MTFNAHQLAQAKSVTSQPALSAVPEREEVVRERLQSTGKAPRFLSPVIDIATPADGQTTAKQLDRVAERSEWQRRYVTKVCVSDAVVVCAAVVLAQYVRFGAAEGGSGEDWTLNPMGYAKYFVPVFSALFAVAWLSAMAGFHTRSPRIIGTGVEEYRRVVAASAWTFGAIAIVTLLIKADIARGYLAVAFPAGTLGLVLSRWAWRKSLARLRAQGGCQTAVLAFGETDAVTNLAAELVRNKYDGYDVVGIGIPGYGRPRGEHLTVGERAIPIVGGERDMIAAIRACGADTVAIAGTEHFGVRGIRRLIWDLESIGVDLVVSTGALDVALSRLAMRPIAGLPLLHIEKPQYQGAKRFQKRAFDVCFALTALALTAPVLAITALAIKLTSRGPVFYSAERIGIDGRPFSMLKFRTMVVDADKQLDALLGENDCDGVIFKMRQDPRVTPIGRVLRRFSIDELPQFVNVLKSDMSVVGPRPPLRREVESYDCDVVRRLLVKPGITGLWQVSGRSDLTWEESVRLDLRYVENWSAALDISILWKTVGAVVRGRGAY